jgi:hypothetical protein
MQEAHEEKAERTKGTRSRAAYQAKRREQSVQLYFRSVEELEAFKAAAEAGGYSNFNAWLLQMLQHATSGAVFPVDYVDGLRKDLEKLRDWLDTAREEATDYRSQVKLLQAQRDALLTLLHNLPEGGEVAARWLDQNASGRASA